MATQRTTPKSIFPDLIRGVPISDKEGNLNTYWELFFSALSQALQKNYKNEGIMLPPLNIDQINAIEALYTPFIGLPLPGSAPGQAQGMTLPDISGQTIFDTTNRVPKVFIITFNVPTPPDPPIVLTAGWKTYTIT